MAIEDELREQGHLLEELLESCKDGGGMLAIVYDPAYDQIDETKSGIQQGDGNYLAHFLQKSNASGFTLILHGTGGDTNEALLMAQLLARSGKWNAHVPLVCGSAMCYLLLKANALIMSPDTRITQVDPLIPREKNQLAGEWIRAIEHLDDADPDLKERSRKVFRYVHKKLVDLLKEKPSLYDHKTDEYEDFGDGEELVRVFMNKDRHEENVTYEELVRLNYCVKILDDGERIRLYKSIVRLCLTILRLSKKRFILVSSREIEEDGDLGTHYIIQ